MVKRLRHRPFTAVTRVRISLGSFNLIRRHSQVVRRGSATPWSPVQIWLSPLKSPWFSRTLLLWTLVCWAHWSFSLIRKMEMGETINHPLCGCASIVIQKNYLSVYNRVVQAILQKGKVIYGEERKCTRTYKMDVQISYRLHSKV